MPTPLAMVLAMCQGPLARERGDSSRDGWLVGVERRGPADSGFACGRTASVSRSTSASGGVSTDRIDRTVSTGPPTRSSPSNLASSARVPRVAGPSRCLQLPPHGKSPLRGCLRLVLCRSERSFGMLISFETPQLAQGTFTQKNHAHAGRTQLFQPDVRSRAELKWTTSRRTRVKQNVMPHAGGRLER
jgi:hypothetical protein